MSRPPSTDAQIRDLERIVARQPESKFFAALAEAYIERGEPARAIEVCERGLRANPGFVRGLVVYARALLLDGREEAAQEIFGQARAENPRDSSVTTTWGALLLSLGRIEEARAAFTEALRTNPLDVDAKRMLATLPTEPAAAAARPPRKTEIGRLQLTPRRPALEVGDDADDTVVIDDRPVEDDRGDSTRPYALQPPTAEPLNPGEPPYPPSPSYPPAPADAAGLPYEPLPPAAAATPPPVPPYAAAPPAYAPAPPPPYGTAPPAYAAAPPPVPPYAAAPPAYAPAPPPPPSASPIFAPVPAAPSRAPRSGGGQARRHTSALVAAQRPRRTSTYVVLGLVAVVVAAVVGGGIYLRTMGQRVARTLGVVDTSLLDGSPARYQEAETRLVGLAAAHPTDARIIARLAEVAAMRALRFDGGAASRTRAEEAVRRTEALNGPTAALTARALLKIQAGDPTTAADLARRAVLEGSSPAATTVLGLAEQARGGLAAAEEQLALAWAAQPPPAIAGCELATVQRRRGRLGEARATLDAVLAAAPQNLCARLERVLLLRQGGREGTRVERESLREPAAPHAALRARFRYSEALVALAQAESGEARSHLEQAVEAAPWDPEYAWALGRALLDRGGDARRALGVLSKIVALVGKPEAPLDLAEAQLRLGLAAEATVTLEKIDRAKLPATQHGRYESYRLWARHDQLQSNAVKVYCAALARTSTADDEVLLTCAVAAFDNGELPEARHFASRVRRTDLRPTARGLVLLSQGDPTGAADSLGRAAEGYNDPGVAGLLLSRALASGARDEAARRTLRRAVVDDAGSVRARVALARALVGTRREEAVALLTGIVAAKVTAPRLTCLTARAYLELGDHARAGQLLAGLGALRALPQVRQIAGLVALAAGDQAKAREEFQAAAAADAAYADPRFELARLAAIAGRFDNATARYDAAMRSSPEDPYRRMRLAVAQAEAGYIEEGEQSLELARKGLAATGCRGLVAGAYLALARAAAARDAKQARRAESLYRQAVSLPGAPAFVLYYAGRYHEARRDLRAAFAAYRGAIERDPQLAEAFLRLGLLLAADGTNHDEATARLREYLKLFPDGEHAARARAELKRMGRTVP